jgi:N utilization substance protein B
VSIFFDDALEEVVHEHPSNEPGDDASSADDISTLSRRSQRALIFHLLYTMEAFDYNVSLESVVDNYSRGFDITLPPDSPVVHTAAQILQEREALDEFYKPLLNNWRFERLGLCTILILRFALWELLHTDMSTEIIINEAVELAKSYAEKDAYKFINGILDQAAKKIPARAAEAAAKEAAAEEPAE